MHKEIRFCSKCHISSDSGKRFYYKKGICHSCYMKEYNTVYKTENKETILLQAKEYYKLNKDDINVKNKKYREKMNFNSNRQKALDRDNCTCSLCGLKADESQLVVHHKDGNGRGKPIDKKNNDLSNLVTLCRSCHIKEHHEEYMEIKRPMYSKWSMKYDCCRICNTDSIKHGGHGLCLNCMARYRTRIKKEPKCTVEKFIEEQKHIQLKI